MAERTRRFNSSSTAEDVLKGVDLTGKTALITGTNSGIGIETARSLALHGAHVVMANRNISASEELRNEILAAKPNAKVDILPIELSSLKSVKEAAKEFLSKGWPLHILILNAGVFSPAKTTTDDGLEIAYGVNHVAQFHLTQLLLPKLRESAPSRVVVVSSALHSHNKCIKGSLSSTEIIAIRMCLIGVIHTFGLVVSLFVIIANNWSWRLFSTTVIEPTTQWFFINVGNDFFCAVNPYALLIFSTAVRHHFTRMFCWKAMEI